MAISSGLLSVVDYVHTSGTRDEKSDPVQDPTKPVNPQGKDRDKDSDGQNGKIVQETVQTHKISQKQELQSPNQVSGVPNYLFELLRDVQKVIDALMFCLLHFILHWRRHLGT